MARQHFRWLLCASLVVLVIATSIPAGFANDQDLLQFLVKASENRWSNIRSGKGTVHVSEWRIKDGKPVTSELTLTGAFLGERFRLCESLSDTEKPLLEMSFDGARLVVWHKDGYVNPPVRIKEGRVDSLAGRFDAYFDPRARDIAKWSRVGVAKIVGRETLSDGECIIIQREDSSTTAGGQNVVELLKFWLNTGKDYTVPKMEITITVDGRTVLRRIVTNEVRQYPNGLWACSKSTSVQYDADGNKTKEQVVTYSPDFEINVPVTKDDLEIKLPSGTQVFDEVLSMEYVTSS